MATRTISPVGGNWSATTAWVEAAVPTAADNVVATSLSGALTIDGTSGSPSLCRSANFTNYVSTLTQASAKFLQVGDTGGGNLILVSGMTYSPNTAAQINFNSTTTGNNITTAGKTMPPCVFNGSGGAWTLTDAFLSAKPLTMTLGTVTANSTLNLQQLISNGGTLNLGGNVTVSSVSTVAGGVVAGASYTITGGSSLAVSSGTLTIKGFSGSSSYTHSGGTANIGTIGISSSTMTVSAGTVTTTGPISLTGSISVNTTGNLDATGQSISGGTGFTMSSSGTFNLGSFSGSASATISAGTTSLTGNFNCTTLTMSGSTTRSITFGSGTITVSGTGTVIGFGTTPTNMTFNCGTSTINSTDTSATTKNITGGGQTFYNLIVNGAASNGTFTINQGNTFNALTFSPNSIIKLANSVTQHAASIIWSGTSGNLASIISDSTGVPATISVASGTLNLDYMSLKDIATTGGACFYAGANSTDVSGNSGWLFKAKPTSGQHFIVQG